MYGKMVKIYGMVIKEVYQVGFVLIWRWRVIFIIIYHHHHHWKSHYPQEPKVHHIAKMRKTIKDFLEDGTRKSRGAPCEAAERR